MNETLKSPSEKKEHVRILLTEDNTSDASLVEKCLKRSELACFEIVRATRLSEAVLKASRSRFDAVILDLFLPDSDGLPTLETFISAHKNTPIIVLTGFDSESVGVEAIRRGAEEYILKGELPEHSLPRFITMAVERWRSKFNSPQMHSQLQFSLNYGPLRVDVIKQAVSVLRGSGTINISLTPIELRILALLIRNVGQILSRSQIVAEIWGEQEQDLSVRSVDKHLSSLKNKTAPVLSGLESVYSVGYRLNPYIETF